MNWVFRCLPVLLFALHLAPVRGAESASDRVRPRLRLVPGEFYFRDENHPVFVLGRNPAGRNPAEFADHFRHAAAAGERLVRIHFTYFHPDETPGEIHPGMLRSWEAVLDAAEQSRLGVLPVLGVWADWNDGSAQEVWHAWDKNPYNAARGGPAVLPSELLEDTPCRRLWFRRMQAFVQHWSGRPAIVGWEIFSELDLITGASEARALEFIERSAQVIRNADPGKRPITASQAGICEWPTLLRSPVLDFIQIHPYAGGKFAGRLDEIILNTVRQRLATYHKPVLIGESGLDARPPRDTLDTAPRAAVGIRHAIWAAVVSGAMNGRALWWQDGYDQFEKASLCSEYHRAAASAAEFVAEVDFTGFAPIPCDLSAGLTGAVVGNPQSRLGWFRDSQCGPPDWPVRSLASGRASLEACPGTWKARFFETGTGKCLAIRDLVASGGRIELELPEFQASVGLKLQRKGN